MPRLNFNIDEATLLKTYRISTLHPTKWEDIDYDFDESIASATVGGAGVRAEREKEDALGLGPARSVKDLDMETKSALLLSSKTFSPAQYLAFAHPNATYHDLTRGIAHLQNSIQAREEALRVLVEEGFDRFVVVKSAVDGLYEDMKHGVLAPETEHAAKPLRDHLRDGVQKANQIFLPVLETASKAEKLRTTLGVFERSRFFFNLPSFIMESIDAGKYDLALRDYKKGKYLLENRPGQLLPLAPSSSALSGSQIPTPKSAGNQQQQMQMQAQQRRILNKVWSSVEKAMGEMRKVLVAQLQDSSRSFEDHERTLETLLEMQNGGVEELIWTYFDSHHVHIMDKMSAVHRVGIRNVETARRDMTDCGHEWTALYPLPKKMSLESQLKAAMGQLEAGEVDVVIPELSSSTTERVWIAILEMVKSTSEVVSTMLPSFWGISKGFIEGKFKRQPLTNGSSSTTGAGTRRSPGQCRTMAYDIVKLYISLISQAFMLSEVSVMSQFQSSSSSRSSLYKLGNDKNANENIETPPPLFPERSNSLLTAVHLKRILNEVVECSNELIALDISGETRNGLKSLVDSLKWRCADILVREWAQDAGIFYHLETWVSDSSIDAPKSKFTLTSLPATRFLAQFELFQRYMATASHKIASVNITQATLPSKGSSTKRISSITGGGAGVVPPMYATKVMRGFLDAVYKLLDGLVLLASDESPAVLTASDPVETKPGVELNLSELFDLKDGNVRLLLVITNLERLGKVVIPSMFIQLESAFAVSMAEDQATLTTMVEGLDQTLFDSYIQGKARIVKEQIRQAILGGEIDWYRTPQPVALRRYVQEVMNYFVEVHGQVYNVAPSLVERVLVALIEELGDEVSTCLKKVARFGTGGLLQIVMELTFIHKSLAHYGRETSAGKKLEDIYTKEVTQAYSPSSKENKDFQVAFDEMQETLGNARKLTGVQFLCFRKAKEHLKEGNKDGSRKEKNRTRGTRGN